MGVKVILKEIFIELQFYGPEIVLVLKYPVRYTFKKHSISVIESPQETPIIIKKRKDILTIRSGKLIVMFHLMSVTIGFNNLKVHPLLKEKPDGAKFTTFNNVGSKKLQSKTVFCVGSERSLYWCLIGALILSLVI